LPRKRKEKPIKRAKVMVFVFIVFFFRNWGLRLPSQGSLPIFCLKLLIGSLHKNYAGNGTSGQFFSGFQMDLIC
jgi:hypothetical protein